MRQDALYDLGFDQYDLLIKLLAFLFEVRHEGVVRQTLALTPSPRGAPFGAGPSGTI